MKYSIVIPVYNSEKSLEELSKRLDYVFEAIIHEDYELILVDDFSKDSSFEVITRLMENDSRITGVQLAKNCGQHSALLCGFSIAQGDFIITMDDDLQHPPEEIPKLIEKMQSSDDLDVVIGSYESKKHSLIRNIGTGLSAYVSYKAYGKPKDLDLTSFRLMRKNVVSDILSMNIDTPRIGNMLLQVNGRIGNVTVTHDKRKYGKSGYTFSRLVKDLISNLFTNSSFPLIVVRDIGMASSALSVLLAMYFIIKYFVSGISVGGWTSTVLIILFIGGMILFAIGIIGDYLLRILNESKKIPNYFIRQIVKKDKPEENE